LKFLASTGTKGGVGKSTFAILLTYKLISKGKKVVLCDCDVECPNDHLLLNTKLSNKTKVYQPIPKLDKRKCRKCGICAEKCRSNAIFWIPGGYPKFIHDLCNSCGVCWHICPFGAIKVGKKEIGEVYSVKINKNFWFISGKSKPNVEETTPIVNEAKRKAIDVAKKINADYIIFDTAAGIHCNVVHILRESDMIFAVTEPTPLGLHDLKISLELAKKLGKKALVIINKSGIGSEKRIQRIAKKYKTYIAGKIPYSKDVLDAYVKRDLKNVHELLKLKVGL